jgi:hypothetical protein
MALTADQLSDFQGDLGIGSDEDVFTDAELERLFTRAGEDYPTAVYYAWRQLLAASTKYIDYRVAQTEEKRSQAYAHIRDMVAYWKDQAAESTNSQGVAVLGLTSVPPRYKEFPYDEDERGVVRSRRISGRWD